MADDIQQGTRKTIDISMQAAKITSDVLKDMLKDFLRGGCVKKGRMSLRQLEQLSGSKLESIEITENNIKDFLSTAKKYDVDFALKRDSSASPPIYHVIFQTNNAENFQRAFSEYASKKESQLENKKAPFNRQKLKSRAKEISGHTMERSEKSRQKLKSRKEMSL